MTSSNSSTPDATPETRAVERQVTTLLTNYAEDMPPTASIETRLRERLASEAAPHAAPPARWRPPRIRPPRDAGDWARGLVSLGLVAALIVGFVGVAWLRNSAKNGGHGVTTGQCTEIIQDGSLPYLCPPPKHVKATVEVTQSYADSIRTAVQLRITTPGALIPHDRPIVYSRPDSLFLDNPTLHDVAGHFFGRSGLPLGSFAYAAGQDTVTDFMEFDPLPQDELSKPQTLTLRIDKLTLVSMGYAIEVKGPWTITFQVTPQHGHSVNLHVAPQTHDGITIQPLRLDIAPSASVFDQFGDGGERLILRISGLDPKTNLMALGAISTTARFPDGSGSDYESPVKLLFEKRPPAAIAGAGDDPSVVVGPTGTVDLEVIFAAPPLAHLTGTQTLTLNQLKLIVDMDSATHLTKMVKGPWTFAIPLG
jgi:hypothetical protein